MAIISIPTSIGGISLQGDAGSILNGPLSALFGGSGVKSLKYPSDLATSATKNHYVQFTIKEVVPVGFEKQASNPISPGQVVGANSNVSAGLNAIVKGVAGIASGLLQTSFPSISKSIDSAVGNISSTLSGGLTISPPTSKSAASISLYMPDTLNASYSSEYEQLSLTANPTINSLRMMSQLAGKANENAAADRGRMDGFSHDPATVYLATQAANRVGGNAQGLGDILLKGEGYALNPQMQMIYRGIDLRSFSLSFTFTPKSAKEAQSVKDIIYTFKRHFAPKLQNAKVSSNENMFLIAPSIFNIDFNLGSKQNVFLPRYGDCVLVDIDVNYAPNGWAAYEDGSPVQTTLNLQFREIEMVTRDKLDNGYDSGATFNKSGFDPMNIDSGNSTGAAQLDKSTVIGQRGLR